MRRVAALSGPGDPSMDGHRVRSGRGVIRSLGDTVTYAPHRSAPARAIPPSVDGPDPGGSRWRTRIWVAGGILASAALIGFGVWAVTTTPATVVVTGAEHGGSPSGDFAFDVTAVRCGVTSVGPGGLEQRAAGQFCLLDVKVTNNGGEPELLDGGAQRLHDTNGVAYAVADNAAVFLNDHDPTLLDEIEPGETVVGVLPFDLPRDARPSEATLRDGMSSPGVRVKLPDPR